MLTASATLAVSVPRGKLGKIIGKGGATKKDIESDYQVEITIPPRDPNADDVSMCDVVVRGPTNAAVESARNRILDICGLRVETPAVAGLRAKLEETLRRKDQLFTNANAAPRGPERDALFASAHQAKTE